MTRALLIWTSLLGFIAGCGEASPGAPPEPITGVADPIIGGVSDSGDSSVVALYGQAPGASSGFLCTASVIAPTVILTAAHCVSPSEIGAGAQFTVIVGPQINKSDSKSGQTGAQRLAVRSVHANPLWSARNLVGGHDEGIVILSQPTTLPPLPFLRQPLSPSLVGKALRIVGYGLDDGSMQTGAGVKRQALTTLRSISTNLIRVGDSRRGTCNGDSGGPAFMDIAGVETIVGTTSYGNADCSDGGYDARVDVDLAFVQQYLPAECAPVCSGRSCGEDGCGGSCGTCADAEMCSAAGQCLAPTGGCAEGGLEQEVNDTALQANPLCAGGVIRGTLASTTDQDWFTWSVSANSTYEVTLSAATPEPVLRVYKLATTGRLSFIGDGPVVSKHTDAGGTYVGRINGGASPNLDYSLSVHTTP